MRIRTVIKGQKGDGKFEGMEIHYRGNFAIVIMPKLSDRTVGFDTESWMQLRFRALHRLEKDGYELLASEQPEMIFRKIGSQPDAATVLLRNLAKGIGGE